MRPSAEFKAKKPALLQGTRRTWPKGEDFPSINLHFGICSSRQNRVLARPCTDSPVWCRSGGLVVSDHVTPRTLSATCFPTQFPVDFIPVFTHPCKVNFLKFFSSSANLAADCRKLPKSGKNCEKLHVRRLLNAGLSITCSGTELARLEGD